MGKKSKKQKSKSTSTLTKADKQRLALRKKQLEKAEHKRKMQAKKDKRAQDQAIRNETEVVDAKLLKVKTGAESIEELRQRIVFGATVDTIGGEEKAAPVFLHYRYWRLLADEIYEYYKEINQITGFSDSDASPLPIKSEKLEKKQTMFNEKVLSNPNNYSLLDKVIAAAKILGKVDVPVDEKVWRKSSLQTACEELKQDEFLNEFLEFLTKLTRNETDEFVLGESNIFSSVVGILRFWVEGCHSNDNELADKITHWLQDFERVCINLVKYAEKFSRSEFVYLYAQAAVSTQTALIDHYIKIKQPKNALLCINKRSYFIELALNAVKNIKKKDRTSKLFVSPTKAEEKFDKKNQNRIKNEELLRIHLLKNNILDAAKSFIDLKQNIDSFMSTAVNNRALFKQKGYQLFSKNSLDTMLALTENVSESEFVNDIQKIKIYDTAILWSQYMLGKKSLGFGEIPDFAAYTDQIESVITIAETALNNIVENYYKKITKCIMSNAVANISVDCNLDSHTISLTFDTNEHANLFCKIFKWKATSENIQKTSNNDYQLILTPLCISPLSRLSLEKLTLVLSTYRSLLETEKSQTQVSSNIASQDLSTFYVPHPNQASSKPCKVKKAVITESVETKQEVVEEEVSGREQEAIAIRDALKLSADSSLAFITNDYTHTMWARADWDAISRKNKISPEIKAKMQAALKKPRTTGAKGSGMKWVGNKKLRERGFFYKLKVGEDIELLARARDVTLPNLSKRTVYEFDTAMTHSQIKNLL